MGLESRSDGDSYNKSYDSGTGFDKDDLNKLPSYGNSDRAAGTDGLVRNNNLPSMDIVDNNGSLMSHLLNLVVDPIGEIANDFFGGSRQGNSDSQSNSRDLPDPYASSRDYSDPYASSRDYSDPYQSSRDPLDEYRSSRGSLDQSGASEGSSESGQKCGREAVHPHTKKASHQASGQKAGAPAKHRKSVSNQGGGADDDSEGGYTGRDRGHDGGDDSSDSSDNRHQDYDNNPAIRIANFIVNPVGEIVHDWMAMSRPTQRSNSDADSDGD